MEINQRQLSIVLPVYNEEGEITLTLERLLASKELADFEYEIIVVNDGSTDHTLQALSKFDVKVISHEHNKGYGAALKTGIGKAKYNNIAICDADGSYPIEQIPVLAKQADEYDMVVGSRTDSYSHLHATRHFVKWFLNKYANYLTKERIPDLNSGLRIFKKDIYERFRNLLPNGFSFTTTITLALLSNDYQVKYLPIEYYKRGGKSKFKPIKDTINFFSLITRTSLFFRPLRVYAPIAVTLLFAAVGLAIYDIFVLANLTDKTMMLFLFGMQFGMIGLLADMISHRR